VFYRVIVFARAQVVKFDSNRVRTLVHFSGFKKSQDQWVTAERLSRAKPVPSITNHISKQVIAKRMAVVPNAAVLTIVAAPTVPRPALAVDPVPATGQVYLVDDRGALFPAHLLQRRESGGRIEFLAKYEGWGSGYNKWVVAQQVHVFDATDGPAFVEQQERLAAEAKRASAAQRALQRKRALRPVAPGLPPAVPSALVAPRLPVARKRKANEVTVAIELKDGDDEKTEVEDLPVDEEPLAAVPMSHVPTAAMETLQSSVRTLVGFFDEQVAYYIHCVRTAVGDKLKKTSPKFQKPGGNRVTALVNLPRALRDSVLDCLVGVWENRGQGFFCNLPNVTQLDGLLGAMWYRRVYADALCIASTRTQNADVEGGEPVRVRYAPRNGVWSLQISFVCRTLARPAGAEAEDTSALLPYLHQRRKRDLKRAAPEAIPASVGGGMSAAVDESGDESDDEADKAMIGGGIRAP
jgi:hypothetical protein